MPTYTHFEICVGHSNIGYQNQKRENPPTREQIKQVFGQRVVWDFYFPERAEPGNYSRVEFLVMWATKEDFDKLKEALVALYPDSGLSISAFCGEDLVAYGEDYSADDQSWTSWQTADYKGVKG